MTEYTVTWTIQVETDSAVDAAREAQRIQRDPDSLATVFNVTALSNSTQPSELIDLDALSETCSECGLDLVMDHECHGCCAMECPHHEPECSLYQAD